MKRFKIGIYGSAADESEKVIKLAQKFGQELAIRKMICIVGATSGLPHEAAKSAYLNGGEVWCFPPLKNSVAFKKLYPGIDLEMYQKIIYIPKYFDIKNQMVYRKYRNVVSTANCDAGIVISGRWGTLNEFTNLIDYGKIIGVLTGSGGISDELPKLMDKIKKEGSGKVIFNSSPKQLVEGVINELSK